MSHWIFVINDSDKEFATRLKSKEWPIFNFTHHRKNLHVGDSVVFYKAGVDGQKFLGTAKLSTNSEKKTNLAYRVCLSDINIWKKNIRVDELLNHLEFIKDKQVWGRFFQGGVRRIDEKDFSTITKQKKLIENRL